MGWCIISNSYIINFLECVSELLYDQLTKLLSDTELTVSSEIQIVKGVIKYIKDNKCDLAKANALFQYINWKIIPYQCIIIVFNRFNSKYSWRL